MFHQSWFAAVLPVAAHDHWGGGPLLGLVALAWVAIIVAVIWLIRETGVRRGSSGKGTPSAAEILDRRFAEGEISAEEYRERRETLSQANG